MLGIFKQRYSPISLALIAAVFVLLAPVFWMRVELSPGTLATRPYSNVDLYERSLPTLSYGFERLAAGELPLWNPYQFCGIPFQADPAAGLFQPLLALFLWLPPAQALAASTFACLFLMGGFFALFLRGIGLRHVFCLLGGIVYAFSGASAAAMNRPELAAVLAWAPLLFWATTEYQRSQRGAALACGGIAGAGCLLSGGYGLSAALLLLWLPYALICAVHKHPLYGRRPLRGLLAVAGMAVLALGLSAVQWLPALRWSQTLANPQALWQLELPMLLPQRGADLLAQWLGPGEDMLPRASYVALAALLVLPAAWFHRQARLETAYFSLAGGLSIALTLLPVQVFGVLPAAVWWFPASFSMGVLAAAGAEKLLTASRDPFSPLVWLPVALLLLIAGAMLLFASNAVRGLVLLYLLVLLPFLLLRARWLAGPTALALALFVFLDCCLASVNYYRHPFADGPAVPPELAQVLKQAEEQAVQGRTLYLGPPAPLGLPGNLGMLNGLTLAGGTAHPLTSPQAAWWNTLRLDEGHQESWPEEVPPALIHHLAASALLVAEERAFGLAALERRGMALDFLRARANVRLYKNSQALPRAYWVPAWYPASGPEAALEVLAAPAFQPREACVIDAPADAIARLEQEVPRSTPPLPSDAATPAATASTAQIMVSEPERVAVQVEASQPGLLVLADTFAEGWTATVDNVPAEILQANAMFRAVAVPPGAHLVAFSYRPPYFWAGLSISLGTLTLLGLAGLVLLFRRS